MKKKKFIFLALTVSLIIGCNKEEPKLPISIEPTSVSLFRDGEVNLKVKNAEGDVVYKSDNEYIATVSSDGIVTGKLVGETTITATALNGEVQSNVKVNPRITFIPEPYLGFGNSKETVLSELVKRGDKYTIDSSSGNILVEKFIDNSDVYYVYSFENEKLTSSAFACSVTSQIMSSVVDFYVERYIVSKQTGSYSFVGFTTDKQIIVGISLLSNSSIALVLYMPN